MAIEIDNADRKLMDAAPAILEASSEAIVTINGKGEIKGFNSQLLLLLGTSAERCKALNIRDMFHDLDALSAAGGKSDEFEPIRLTKPDGTTSWVLVKVLPIGNVASDFFTVLVHDPETIRRIVDRLDHIENVDVGSGLFNRRKGIVEFEQLQASNLSGGCFLAKIDAGLVDGSNGPQLDDYLRSIAKRFRIIEEQSVLCRLSSSEVLFVYTAEEPVSVETFGSIIEAIKGEREFPEDLAIWISHLEWSGHKISVNTVFDRLRTELTSINDPHLLTGMSSQKRADALPSYAQELEAALNAGELDFYIQPQISAETRQVVGGELLVRWFSPSGEIIAPLQFIEFLEQGEFADRFYHWSIQRTVELLKQVRSELDMWMPLSLNLAVTHFSDMDSLQVLVDAVEQNNIPDRILEIEVTERILAENPELILRNLNHMQEKGFKVAIDDFGTGYSSLSYLRKFPLDRLKIDRVFVTNLSEIEEDRLIVTAIVSLAHVLGLEVVAEGIEDGFQSSFLKDIGCEYFQGYLTGKPMPVDEFVQFAKQKPEHCDWADTPADVLNERNIGRTARRVKWKKSFSTDVVSVDNEHRLLIDGLNEFASQYLDDPDSVDFVATLDGIASEVIKHFEHEEEVMFNIGYPRYEAHREKHKWLIADIAKRKAEIAENRAGTNFDEVLQYLKYWLLRHLVSEDTHLHRFLNKPMSERRV